MAMALETSYPLKKKDPKVANISGVVWGLEPSYLVYNRFRSHLFVSLG
jgi:hypothetical protein